MRRTGLFAPAAVTGLVRRCRAGQATGIRENQALVAILSTQLWHHAFIETGVTAAPGLPAPDVVLQDVAPVPN